jgi:hypothetical protein
MRIIDKANMLTLPKKLIKKKHIHTVPMRIAQLSNSTTSLQLLKNANPRRCYFQSVSQHINSSS